MSPLFETIRVVDGVLLHTGYHAARMNHSRQALLGIPDASPTSDFTDILNSITLPENLPPGIHRCRVSYGKEIDEIIFSPYLPRDVRSLTLVEADELSYTHKFTDRTAIEGLREGVEGDDILIVRRGLITDTSFSNIVFFDGTEWITPASPLLPGTARARLLDERRIIPRDITPGEIGRLNKAVLVNAMMEFGEKRWIDVRNIR